jgi:hypothetical protein
MPKEQPSKWVESAGSGRVVSVERGARTEQSYKSDDELAAIFELLRHRGYAFAGGEHGWPPAAVFELLREKRLIEGAFTEVTWKGPGDWVVRENG